MRSPRNAPLSRCLSIDLEVGRRDGRIYRVAGVRGDTNESLSLAVREVGLDVALNRLDDLAGGAEFVLGHKLIAFDLPHLQAVNPNLRMLGLPAVDTLMLNPLAFPRNPYHHLVKHYKDGGLRRGSVNDPELDARLALEAFDNQMGALPNAPSDLLTAWHWLAAGGGGEGFDMVFSHLRGSQRPSESQALRSIRASAANACQEQVRQIIQEVAAHVGGHGWPLAYALAWISVAGGNSVMPPWVRHEVPEAGRLVGRLRNTACANARCEWCRERHDARKELTRWFGFPDFRPEPKDDTGRSLQRAITEEVMAGSHVLGIMPTGAGKSLCYQVPALSRYDKTGSLTVVISPLVALMADQVAGMEAQGIGSCVAINGLLSMPERAHALDRLRFGDASIVLAAPEQLRSTSFCRALDQREIGGWVLDEAHCLSKWGHDFRPDYRYVGRFIRKKADSQPIPPVLCLTATAKPDVKTEIVDYFSDTLGIDLKVFDGGSQRANLKFVVIRTTTGHKHEDIHRILASDLPKDGSGGAIIYCSTRRHTEELAGFLQAKGMEAAHFHAGLPPETKKSVQRDFIEGDLRAIAATNAFGMGIDKPDVRLVVHADIPGSLENYLQEAGRAGRDQRDALCVLLYTPGDVERQFGLSARSRLTRREIHGVLRALRNLDRKKRLGGRVEATAGEILTEDEEDAFRRDSNTDDTRVRTAVSWLEEAVLLSREENRVQVFPSSLRIRSLEEAETRFRKAKVAVDYLNQLLGICRALIEADADEGISTDELMALTGLTSEGVRNALYDMERMGIASNDTALTAFVHEGVQRSSRKRLEQAAELEKALINLMREQAPDMDTGDTHILHLRQATQHLKDEGHDYALPERLWRILGSIGADGRGEGGGGGSIDLRRIDREAVRVTLRRGWEALSGTAAKRRAGANRVLDHLLGALPPRSRGTDLLVETTLGKLMSELRSDLHLKTEVHNYPKLLDHSLLWLHEQEVIQLNRGLAVFRPAMTIRLESGTRGFANTDYESLRLHYEEQVLQVHIMAEYATQGLESMTDAIRLAMDYFTLSEEDFLRYWMAGRKKEVSRQTTPASWRRIVESLNDPAQRRIVADGRRRTMLVLAGPGSGKTRVLVHRIAYLVRAKREDPHGILALAYNRHAAVEIRRRLADLIGDDARGVIVLTCHALAMRLIGASFSKRAGNPTKEDFRAVLTEAADLLRGKGLPPDEADEYRSRLLRGFRWILVDEYQDINAEQYDLLSALAGRTIADKDAKLHMFAVGDDDQNIYAWDGSSVKFIRRFEADYQAKPAYLVGNYRSTGHIISAANAVIEPARNRLKAGHSISINRARTGDHPGGTWSERDPLARGRVQVISVGKARYAQGCAAVGELQRLASLTRRWDWSTCAVVARDWKYLHPVRSLCELSGIPAEMADEDFSGFWHLRETRAMRNKLGEDDAKLVRPSQLADWLSDQPTSPWNDLLREAVAHHRAETGNSETPAVSFLEWLAEWGRDFRRQQRGLLLTTAHRAKGREFDHVVILDGAWKRVDQGEDLDAPRRLYYVAMTRARQTLALMRGPGLHPLQHALEGNPSVLHRHSPDRFPAPSPEIYRRYQRLSLRDVDLGFAGRKSPGHPVHKAIGSLSPGDPLTVRHTGGRWRVMDSNGFTVGSLSRGFDLPSNEHGVNASVLAIATWDREKSEPQYLKTIRSPSWEVVVPELVIEPMSSPQD